MISLELIFRITKDGNSITVQKGFKDGIEIIFSDCDTFRHKATFFTYDEIRSLDVNFSHVVEQLYDDFLYELGAKFEKELNINGNKYSTRNT